MVNIIQTFQSIFIQSSRHIWTLKYEQFISQSFNIHLLSLLLWEYIVTFTKVHNMSLLNSRPPSFSFISPPGIVSTGLIFPFTYSYTWYFPHIHPLHPFLIPYLLPLVPTPRSNRDVLCGRYTLDSKYLLR
jgi:hypothetical protein